LKIELNYRRHCLNGNMATEGVFDFDAGYVFSAAHQDILSTVLDLDGAVGAQRSPLCHILLLLKLCSARNTLKKKRGQITFARSSTLGEV